MRRAAWPMVVALTLAGCVETDVACGSHRACDVCAIDGCGWCFETGVCQAPGAFCPGDIAQRPDQCEEPEARTGAARPAPARAGEDECELELGDTGELAASLSRAVASQVTTSATAR